MNTARNAILARLKDEDELVRVKASEALDRLDAMDKMTSLRGRLGSLPPRKLIGMLHALTGVRSEACLKLGVWALSHEDEAVRLSALDLLSDFGDWRTTTHVEGVLSDSSALVRAKAVEVLGRFGNRQAGGSAAKLLSDENSTVAAKAAEAVGLLGYAPAAQKLTALSIHDDSDVRCAAVFALGAIGLFVSSDGKEI